MRRRSGTAHKLPATHPIKRPVQGLVRQYARFVFSIRLGNRDSPVEQTGEKSDAWRGDLEPISIDAISALLHHAAVIRRAAIGAHATTGCYTLVVMGKQPK